MSAMLQQSIALRAFPTPVCINCIGGQCPVAGGSVLLALLVLLVLLESISRLLSPGRLREGRVGIASSRGGYLAEK